MAMHRQRTSRKPKEVAVSPFLRLSCIIICGVLVPWWVYSSSWASSSTVTTSRGSISKRLGGNKQRVAIVIPFVGEGPEAIPPYLELFCDAASGSASLVDFLLIHNGVLDGYRGDACPSNVIFLSLRSMEDFSHLLLRVIDKTEDADIAVGSKAKLAQILSNHIIKYPYILVEFKPALGHIFESYLEGYSHWGYSDLDILFGDLPRWITEDELTDFDIVTYGFGDQDRLYLRGQFTFHKNNNKINQLWRSCEYLSHMDKRFANVLRGEQQFRFESAEGCYSAAILERTDVRVKYTVKAFTDVDPSDTTYSHGLFVGTGSHKDTTVLYKAASKSDGEVLSRLSDTWFEQKDSVYSNPIKPLMFEVGDRERVPLIEKKDAKCMFWAQKKYQSLLCADDVDPTDTVFWIDGQLYKQKYERQKLISGRIVTAPFFHFQEWKRYFRSTQLASFQRASPVRTFVLSKEGVLPLYNDKQSKVPISSPLGLDLRKWHGIKGNDRSQLPGYNYCLISGPRKFPPNPPAPQCQLVTSWRDTEIVEILSSAPAWGKLDIETEVTMALTLQIQAEQASELTILNGLLELVGGYLNRWQGQPSVLVVHVAGATPEAKAALRMKFGPGSDLSHFGLDTCLVAGIFSNQPVFVSRKALMNMAIDASPTRWVISGFELERGVVVSHDTAFFAHRIPRIHESLPGSVYIVPQFGVVNQESDFTLPALWAAKVADKLQALSKLEHEGICEGEEDSEAGDDGSDVFDPFHEIWWRVTKGLITGAESSFDEDTIEKQALALDDIQLSLIALLTEKKHYNLYAMDVSPILLIDNLGPVEGMLTSKIAREVEEFGGKQCYNGLRLAQLATFGYDVNVLAGAFALSTPITRNHAFAGITGDGALGTSRCDGCFMFFEEKHEDILEDISRDERKRPAKAAVLWDHSDDSKSLSVHT